jgi:hypothetical protein
MEALKLKKRALVYVAWGVCLVASFPGSALQVAAQQAVGPEQGASLTAKVSELPDSPGATLSKSSDDSKQRNTTAQQWGVTPSPQPVQSQSPAAAASQQQAPQKPVGTAVAEAPNASGIAASQPAGVAIAPAKQRRVRTIVLRMGAIVGAGVAVGSVVALTAATPSKPPGAH